METTQTDDKAGAALNAQRFQMLKDIAQELQGDVTFPTCFDVAVRLRHTLNDPNVSLDQVATLVSAEPLISSKLLRLANSVIYNPRDRTRDLTAAINRLGLQTVRSAAMAVAMKQILLSKDMVCFNELMTGLWDHSLRSAAAAQVLAQRLTRINPGEALLAGLIHDLGAFYMLYRASQYDELRQRPDTVRYLIIQWHESIGESLFNALGLDESIISAVRDHDQPRAVPPTPRNLSDIVYASNILAGGLFEWGHIKPEEAAARRESLDDSYLALQPEIDAHTEEIRAAFV